MREDLSHEGVARDLSVERTAVISSIDWNFDVLERGKRRRILNSSVAIVTRPESTLTCEILPISDTDFRLNGISIIAKDLSRNFLEISMPARAMERAETFTGFALCVLRRDASSSEGVFDYLSLMFRKPQHARELRVTASFRYLEINKRTFQIFDISKLMIEAGRVWEENGRPAASLRLRFARGQLDHEVISMGLLTEASLKVLGLLGVRKAGYLGKAPSEFGDNFGELEADPGRRPQDLQRAETLADPGKRGHAASSVSFIEEVASIAAQMVESVDLPELSETLRRISRNSGPFKFCAACEDCLKVISVRDDNRPRYEMIAVAYCESLIKIRMFETAYRFSVRQLQTAVPSTRRRFETLIARCAVRLGRAEEARRIYTDMIISDPSDAEAYYGMATLLHQSNIESRLALLAAANSLKKIPPMKWEISRIEALIGIGRLDEALKYALDLLCHRPDKGDALLCIANVYLILKERCLYESYVSRYFSVYSLKSKIATSGDGVEGALEWLNDAAIASAPVTDGPLVTIIMTTFNSITTVKQAIRSVQAQSYRNIRLIVVDDCSTDGTQSAVVTIANQDNRVRVMLNQQNNGTYWSKNQALRTSDSEFYTFHDSDDWMHPNRIEEHVEFMRRNPSVVCTHSLWFRMTRDGRSVERPWGGFTHDNPASTFFPAAVIKQLGYFDSVRTGADSEYLARIRLTFGHYSVAAISKPLAVGLHHDASLTTKGAAALDDSLYSPVRLQYWKAWTQWHQTTARSGQPCFIEFPLRRRRPFKAPTEILPAERDQ